MAQQQILLINDDWINDNNIPNEHCIVISTLVCMREVGLQPHQIKWCK